MFDLLLAFILIAIGFGIGFFVYHNNQKKANDIGDKIKDEIKKKE
ncbi:hypothetical protein [Campylobacter sp. CCS1377]|uniref:Small hydrophobic protein n=1 Tax=Campylobacter sp. CCS1377 TaxID=3158229 RepID=A0AAU7E5Q9_9BACT